MPMTVPPTTPVLVALLVSLGVVAAPRPAGAQWADSASAAVRWRPSPAAPTISPRSDGAEEPARVVVSARPGTSESGAWAAGSKLHVAITTAASAASSATVGMLVGVALDQRACRRANRGDPDLGSGDLFTDPCAFYETERRTGIGWYAGALAGATVGAALAVHRRCPARRGVPLALAGAVAGAAPAALYLARGASGYRSPGVTLALATPLLQAAASTALLSRCGRG